jgi:ribonuclease P protein component
MSQLLRFPRRAHLRASAEFQAVFGGGTRFSGPLFRLQVLPAPVGDGADGESAPAIARLGMTVSKRVDKLSHERNRIRRQVRECFRLQRAQLPPGDYVVQAKPEAASADNAKLREGLLKLLARASTLKPQVPTGTMPAAAAAGPTPTAS